MRLTTGYRNHGPRARRIARLLDFAIAPLAGMPRKDVRRSTDTRPLVRILLIRPDHAGDLLMATPAIHSLRLAHPEAVIDVLASPWGAPALAGNPDLDHVRTIEATWFEPDRHSGPDPARLIGAIASIRGGRYDAAADLRGDFRSVLLARASGARRRAGFSRLGLERFLTDFVPFDPGLDHISRNHAVVSLLGAAPLERRRPVFTIPPEAMEAAARLLAPLPAGRPILAVFPGTNRPRASWGAARFAEACRILWLRKPISIVIGGREADGSAAQELAAGLRPFATDLLDLTGRTDLAQAGAVIRRASVVLANDSGAAHLAVAAGTPVAAIFGPTDPRTLWTWEGRERYVALAGESACPRPCWYERCGGDHGYSQITPARVAETLSELLAVGPERRIA
jgi:heptosyltransferase-2/heptosyltransferase-3